jgi:hypothetical protein
MLEYPPAFVSTTVGAHAGVLSRRHGLGNCFSSPFFLTSLAWKETNDG